MTVTSGKETLGFQAEVKQLLHLMIHSLYGNKEIFLRELVSNASDACDKLRFEGIADSSLLDDDQALRIRVSYDAVARTITVSDNGIGLSRQEVIEHIGTIARSGTREFLAQLTSEIYRAGAVDQRAQGIHLIAVEQDIHFYDIAVAVADGMVVERRITAGLAF